jgi:hypothetical protein
MPDASGAGGEDDEEWAGESVLSDDDKGRQHPVTASIHQPNAMLLNAATPPPRSIAFASKPLLELLFEDVVPPFLR